jgi:hypothetical protein
MHLLSAYSRVYLHVQTRGGHVERARGENWESWEVSYALLGLLVLLGIALILLAWSKKRNSPSDGGWVETSRETFEAGGLTSAASMSVREVLDEPLPPLGSVPGPAYRIEYVNGDGAASERVIAILDVSQNDGRIYILAHCSRAKENLTFRADRIREMYDHHTGVRISQPMQFFRQFVTDEKPEVNEHLSVMSRARLGLIGLLWIALSDRPIAEENLAAMLSYIEKRRALPGSRAETMQWDSATAKQWLLAERPTFEQAEHAVARMQRGGNEARLFRETSERLIGSDKLCKRREKLLRSLR